jgi:GT2 family glycosyltransferase
MSITWGDGQNRVLIVLPTLGRRIDYLYETLTSIRTQDLQADILVVAPRDAEAARDVAAAFGLSVLDDPGGLSAAINLGLNAAAPRHAYGNWLGDDDLLAAGSLARTVSALDDDHGAAVAYGQCIYIDGSGRQLWISKAGRLAASLLSWGPNLIPQPGMLFRLRDFRELGGLDETLDFAMDLDLLLRLRRRGRLIDVRQPVSSFRWHQDSLTVSGRDASLAEAEAVKRRYLSPLGQLCKPVWERPVRLATKIAVRAMARKRAQFA